MLPLVVRVTTLHKQLGLAMMLLAALLLSETSLAESPNPIMKTVLSTAQKLRLDEQNLALAAVPLNGPGEAHFLNADQPFNPGSIMKVVTTYAALELLGPTYQWHTRLYTDGTIEGDTLQGNLYYAGSGDPKLTEERLWLLLRELRSMGIDHIQGDLVLDGSVFNLPNGIADFDDDGGNPNAPFLVEPNGLLTNLNVLRIRSRADQRGVHSWMEPQLAGVELDNQIVVRKYGACPRRFQFDYTPSVTENGLTKITLTGVLPEGCSTSSYLSILDQADYTGALLVGLWQQLGGTLTGQIREGLRPRDKSSQLLATTSSHDLVTMVRDINKWSNNVMVRQLYLTLGAKFRTPDDADDLAAADRTIREWMTDKGIDNTNLVFENGSGLSRSERISARQMGELLEHAWASRFSAELIASLPLVAMDGTMRRRLGHADMAGMGHIKTGSLKDVRSIAGYTRDENNTTWVVVAMVNDLRAWKTEPVLDEIIEQVHLAARLQPIHTASNQ
ncbi:D-alanyl-D-alanine carboxypeptidase/D-alanyl-D-alanine-endopeptidase [Alcanivorax nanhaiticus]|uniref:D-alanyl-D-alanine carboxypeptidase/D-alanyl-D-alanine-endopeptidase n=1 Tax=Alcanivorax nanhaiticus TaxID=1177154 RepID=A0A095UUT6_9GAMM|nr:D-alanyl-D-alanine carboxypeptidase/D-alanyl-D-alanine-endopeptidase [Alcanivorax nanhaiticus]KGD66300.1 D-alanyl-D-alanine carboxypeptidase/D-alanyl-D-alanine-endopeptidase [Alcanivorax nanhaiticus]